MKDVELYGQVRHSVRIEGLSRREAARRFGLDPRTVAKMLVFSVPPGYRRSRPPARPKLDPFVGIIDQILEDDKGHPAKQRHTSKRIFERLRDEHGYVGGLAMTPTSTMKGSRLYRYYASMDVIRSRPVQDATAPQRLPAGMVEDVVIGQIRRMLRTPEVAARTVEAFRQHDAEVDEQAVITALGEFDGLWTSLFPAEQARIVQLLVERVTVASDSIAVDLRHDGIGSIVRDMMTPQREAQS